jgi:drug/metabolite transporter (DMT)-like permease
MFVVRNHETKGFHRLEKYMIRYKMTQKQSRLLFLTLCLIWGTTWLAIRLTVTAMSPLTGASLRFILATAAVLIFARVKGFSLRLPSRAMHGWMVICAILTYVLDYGLIYWAEQHLSAGVTAIFFATFPLFTALFGFWLLPGRELNRTGFIGIFLGLAGIVIIYHDQLMATRFDRLILLASLAVTLAALSAALSMVLVKKKVGAINSVSVTFHQLVWGTLGLVVLALLFEPLPRSLPPSTALLATIYLGLVGTALAFILYYRLLQDKTAVFVSTIGYITPLVAVLLDLLLFGLMLPLRTWLGLGVVFSGIYLVNKPQEKPIQKRT